MFRKIRRVSKDLISNCINALFNPIRGYVLMLHRIGPIDNDRLEVIEELKVSEETLQKYVNRKRKRFDFISLDELYVRLTDSRKRKRPFICVTLDDGYRDNLTNGLPFFVKNNIPFAVFVTSSFINRKPAFNYPFILERVIFNNEFLLINGEKIDCSSVEKKNLAFRKLKKHVLSLSYESFEDSFKQLLGDYLRPEYYEDLFLNETELRVLASSPLCTIGAHTVTHCQLSNVPDAFLEYELNESRKQIKMIVNQPCDYVSYPFGWESDLDERVVDTTRELGYRIAFVAHGGGVRLRDHDLYRVKRTILLEK